MYTDNWLSVKLSTTMAHLSFPIGMGYEFKGIYNIWEKNINLFSGDSRKDIESKSI